MYSLYRSLLLNDPLFWKKKQIEQVWFLHSLSLHSLHILADPQIHVETFQNLLIPTVELNMEKVSKF